MDGLTRKKGLAAAIGEADVFNILIRCFYIRGYLLDSDSGVIIKDLF